MKKESNSYIVLYATVLVVISAIVLALASTSLRSAQLANVQMVKRLSILHSIGLDAGADTAVDMKAFVNSQYGRFIEKELVVSSSGEPISGCQAFDIDLRGELVCASESRRLPIFVAKLEDGSHRYIFPLSGQGLWGPLWGYIALEEDLNTVYGISLEHKSETPGLGAEITRPAFTDQFRGKSVYEGEGLVSIAVLKNQSTASNPHAVDAIAGGTMTSKGVDAMIRRALQEYEPFLRRMRAEREAAERQAREKELQSSVISDSLASAPTVSPQPTI